MTTVNQIVEKPIMYGIKKFQTSCKKLASIDLFAIYDAILDYFEKMSENNLLVRACK